MIQIQLLSKREQRQPVLHPQLEFIKNSFLPRGGAKIDDEFWREEISHGNNTFCLRRK